MAGRDWRNEVVLFTALASVETATVVINTLYKAATLKGLSYFVFIAYSYIIGTLILLPLPFIFRRSELPPLKMPIFCRIVISASIGILDNVLAYKGLEYSSTTLYSAVNNLTPAFTFVLAVIFRMEDLNLRSSTTRLKIIGSMLSISGALVAVLYKGPIILSSTSSSPTLRYHLGTSQTNWVIGGLLLLVYNFFSSIWYILQNQVIKMYPHEQMLTLIYFLCKTSIALPICFIMEPKWSHWTLRLDIALVAIVVAGLFGPSYNTLLYTWVLHLKGPVYASIFKPFSIAIAAAFGVLFLGDALFLGSVVGATILLFGFYAVIWGKAQEEDTKDCGFKMLRASTDGVIPLLQS